MKTKHFELLKDLIKKSYCCNDFVLIKKHNTNIKVYYIDKVVTICECGFAYLISWYCEGFITSGFASDLDNICKEFNNQF